MAERYLCILCGKHVSITAAGKYRQHKDGDGACDASGTLVSARQLEKGPIAEGEDPAVPVRGRDFDVCEDCGRDVPINPNGELRTHSRPGGFGAGVCVPADGADGPTTLLGSRQSSGGTTGSSTSPSTGRVKYPQTVTMTPEAVQALGSPASTQPTVYAQQELATGTPPATPTAATYAQPGAIPAEVLAGAQPSAYAQPGAPPRALTTAEPMTELGARICAEFKQLFFQYNNRRTGDNRSAQQHLGPSEIGTPCDRRLVGKLLGTAAVNPGGDGWAAFVGTCIHAGLAEMFSWADGGTGRFAVEQEVRFPSALVPRGTADLLDRVLLVLDDHKAMGRFSLDKLRGKGPSRLYRNQVHIYAYGMRLKGEKVGHVAVVAWPREASSLDDLYVWTEPYDPTVAAAAFKRVEGLKDGIDARRAAGSTDRQIFELADVAKDCTYCPFHAPGDKHGNIGCNGKK